MGRGVGIILVRESYYLTSFDNFNHKAPKVVTGLENGAKMYELNDKNLRFMYKDYFYKRYFIFYKQYKRCNRNI